MSTINPTLQPTTDADPHSDTAAVVRAFAVLHERMERGVAAADEFDRGWAEYAAFVDTLAVRAVSTDAVIAALDSGELSTRDTDDEFATDFVALRAEALCGVPEDVAENGFVPITTTDITRLREAADIAATAPAASADAALEQHRIYGPALESALGRSGIADMGAVEAAVAGLLMGLRIAALAAAEAGCLRVVARDGCAGGAHGRA